MRFPWVAAPSRSRCALVRGGCESTCCCSHRSRRSAGVTRKHRGGWVVLLRVAADARGRCLASAYTGSDGVINTRHFGPDAEVRALLRLWGTVSNSRTRCTLRTSRTSERGGDRRSASPNLCGAAGRPHLYVREGPQAPGRASPSCSWSGDRPLLRLRRWPSHPPLDRGNQSRRLHFEAMQRCHLRPQQHALDHGQHVGFHFLSEVPEP